MSSSTSKKWLHSLLKAYHIPTNNLYFLSIKWLNSKNITTYYFYLYCGAERVEVQSTK